MRGEGTLRNISANAIASSEGKSIGVTLYLDITLEMYSY